MTNWIQRNKKSIIRSAFLVPIFFVVAISISHVVSWYDIANPISWAIYLSIAIEIAALSAIAAASVKVKGFSIWFVFSIVTLVQFIGNIFFCYTDIDSSSKFFKDWIELTQPIIESMGIEPTDLIAQKRFLALLEGGLLPLISLTCLHFFIKYGDQDEIKEETKIDDPVLPSEPIIDEVKEPENELTEEIPVISEEPSSEFDLDKYDKKIEEVLNSSEPEIEIPREEIITPPVEQKKPSSSSKNSPLSHKMAIITKNNQKKNDSKSK